MVPHSFRFIWIPMLWVYVYYAYFEFFQSGDRLDFRIWRLRRQILKSKLDPRAERVNLTA